MIAHMVQMMLADDTPSWHIELMMRELARPSTACQALVEEFISPMFSQLLAIVSEFLPGDAPLIVRQRLAFSVVAQCLLYRYHRPIGRLLVGEETFQRMFDIEETARQITSFSLGGIRAAGAAREGEASAEPLPGEDGVSHSRLSRSFALPSFALPTDTATTEVQP